jgi:hypothetical protein
LDRRGTAKSRIIQRVEILLRCSRHLIGDGPIGHLDLRVAAGVGLDQRRIDAEVLATDQPFGDAPRQHRVEQMPEQIALAEAAMPVLGEG